MINEAAPNHESHTEITPVTWGELIASDPRWEDIRKKAIEDPMIVLRAETYNGIGSSTENDLRLLNTPTSIPIRGQNLIVRSMLSGFKPEVPEPEEDNNS